MFTYFYHSLTRTSVIIFGSLFDNIYIVRKDKTTDIEIERFKVPIIFSPKEKYVTRLFSDPDLMRANQITLPRMSFDITNFGYDPKRKQNSLLKIAKEDTPYQVTSQYVGVPYDLTFELDIYARNIDDGTHIVEQILPYFSPEYTLTAETIPSLGFRKDIPIILENVVHHVNYEGDRDSVRYVNWTLTFSMKMFYYGPVSNPKIIRKVITNIYNDPSLKSGYVTRLNLESGNNGVFKIDDIIYQGNDINTANAYGTVLSWTPGLGALSIGSTQGTFKINNTIRAASSNAAYQIASFNASPLKLASITVEPDPIDAEPTDDYGYSTTISEFPNA